MTWELLWSLRKLQTTGFQIMMVAAFALVNAQLSVAREFVSGAAFFIAGVAALAFLPIPRVTRLELALPIHGRVLVAARLLNAQWHLLPQALIWLGFVLAHKASLQTGWLLLSVNSAAMLSLTVPYVVRRDGVQSIPKRRLLLPTLGLMSALTICAYLAPIPLFAVSVAVLSGAALWWVLRCAPAGYLLDDVSSDRRAVANAETSASAHVADVTDAALVRRLFLRQLVIKREWFIYVLLVFSGATGNVSTMTLILLMSLFSALRLRMQWTFALPVSTRARWLGIVGLPVLGCCLCVFLGNSIGFTRRLSRPMGVGAARSTDVYRDDEDRIALPLEYWLIAEADSAPRIVAPWGESHRPFAYRTLGQTFYNPYSAPVESSPQYVDWQMRRATTAVYGRAYSREAYKKAYEHLPDHTTDALAVRILRGAALLCTALMLCMLLSIPQRWYRRDYIRRAATVIGVTTFLGLAVLNMRETHFGGINLFEALVRRALFIWSSSLPSNPLLVAAIAALPVALLAWLSYQQFKHIEWAPTTVVTPR